ncbi:MAG: YncE family protein [Polyangiaceae bacterium]
MKRLFSSFGVASLVIGCGGSSPPPAATTSAQSQPIASATSPSAAATAPAVADAGAAPVPQGPAIRSVAFPGVTAPASVDLIAYEPVHARVWVPVGNDGSVDVYDVASAAFTHVAGFATAQRERKGKTRTMGPSSATAGDGFVYIGDRGSSEVCPVDASTLKPAKCTKLKSSADFVTYVASTKEVWATTPEDQSITILDASKPDALKIKTSIKMAGSPEGSAVDAAHGFFLTNLEDKDKTLVIDVKTHKIVHTWASGCGTEGPRGVVADSAHGFVFVACADHVQALDANHEGAPLGKLDVAAGVDNIEWLASQGLLYAAAKSGKLVTMRAGSNGALTAAAAVTTPEGARNAVVDPDGTAYLVDGQHAQLVVVPRELALGDTSSK